MTTQDLQGCGAKPQTIMNAMRVCLLFFVPGRIRCDGGDEM